MPAFLSLLGHLPKSTGMAFVLVQHLSPKHESALPLLLAKATAMPVLEATDGLELLPDHVYISPPAVSLTLDQGVLHLEARQDAGHHVRLIDECLISLARAAKDQAIGVILSGTGSDGTRGLQAIHAAGGTTLVQDPATAPFDSMPRSAIAAGCVDHVLSPEAIAGTLAQLASLATRVVPAATPGEPALAAPPQQGLRRVLQLLWSSTGVDFTQYKPSPLHRHLERRMLLCKAESLDGYVRYLEEHPEELQLLHQDLLIHVTGFFRDPSTFAALQQTVFPELFQDRPAHLPFRIWVPGCSTGEEVYSLVISLLEYLGPAANTTRVQVFGTDLSAAAIQQARAGIYPAAIAESLSADRLQRYFVKTDRGYQVQKSLRNLCIFAQQNLVSDPPFSRIDLISCRNVLIYLGPQLQQKILLIFHYALRPVGFLMLGSAETVGSSAALFSLVDKRSKIYRKKGSSRPPGFLFPYRSPLAGSTPRSPPKPDPVVADVELQEAADRLVLARYGPPGVIINGDLEILHFRGQMGPYLGPAPSSASLHLLEMAREGLALALRTAIHQAKKSGSRVRKEGLLLGDGGGQRSVNIEVAPISSSKAGGQPCFLVLFEESPRLPPASARKGRRVSSLSRARHELEQLREELRTAREHLRTVLEQQETTSQDLRSATEQSQSSREELQSTHEELVTTQEELQATNEELTTANAELQHRNAELNQLNSELHKMINSARVATVTVNRDRRIRHFTPLAAGMLGLSAADVGRSILDVKARITLPDLDAAISEVIEHLAVIERPVCDRNGFWYALRLHPYKAQDNRVEGAVMTLLDIGQLKRSLDELHEAKLRNSR